MTDILIRGMEMPPEGYKTIILHSNGRVYEPTSEELIVNKIADATELPQHGDLIDLSELQKFPIRLDHYDKEHGDEHFVYGIESLMEYAECLPVIVPTERRDADA